MTRLTALFPAAWIQCVSAMCALILLSSIAQAHPISLSAAVADIREDRVIIELDIMLEDLVMMHKLQADGDMRYSAADLSAAAKKHRDFILKSFHVIDPAGNKLKGSIESENFEQIDAVGVIQADLMRHSIVYTLVYPFAEKQPKYLTFVQYFGGTNAPLPALMDLHFTLNGRLFDRSEQITHGRPHTIEIDWNAKSDGKLPTFAELRKRRSEQLKDRLGIGSYSGLFSFLYITRFEVRHEILFPLLTLEKWVKIARHDPDFLDVDEQSAAREQIEAFLNEHSRVLINGGSVKGKLTRLNFFSVDISDFALNAEPRRVSVHQARVGVILSFAAPQVPKRVEVRWDAFNDFAPYVQSSVLVGNQAPTRHTFQPQMTDFTWSGELTPVEIKPVSTAGRSNDEKTKTAMMKSLLVNIYQAFEFRDDEAVYDALQTSVDGRLLQELYLKIKRSLIVAEQGGAMSTMTDVDVRSLTPVSSAKGAMSECVWQVSSVSEHWGHIHKRVSEYRARINTVDTAGVLKIDKFQLLEEKRIQFETSIRGYDPN
ncbi:MAG: hypothetical protein U0892_08470 [Pirellulales bacterium]